MLTDAEVHGWDLAKGLGEQATIEPETASFLLPAMQAQEGLIRGSGMFGARLLAILGRRP